MKKILLVLLLIMALVMAGCGEKKEVKPVTDGLQCDISVSYNGMQIKGRLQKPKDGTCAIKITDPPALAGVTMSFTEKGVKLGYLGLSYTLSADALPETGFGQILVNTLNNAKTGLSGTKSGDEYILKGSGETGSFTLTVDQNALPKKLSVPSAGFEADFHNYK